MPSNANTLKMEVSQTEAPQPQLGQVKLAQEQTAATAETLNHLTEDS